jgi:indolepyruvate ferredoxin oxidoreductase beta subunit
MTFDVVFVGVGGQGVLTIADLIIGCAFEADVPASYCPTKGMAQRGGFVKAEVRLGREGVGPRIAEGTANLVVAMERSEALKGLPFLQSDGTFLLYDHVWTPTGVMLGVDPYPERKQVLAVIERGAGRIVLLDPADLPSVGGRTVRPNIFVLGAAIGRTPLGEVLSTDAMESTIEARWPEAAGSNLEAFRSGLAAGQLASSELPRSSPSGELPNGRASR